MDNESGKSINELVLERPLLESTFEDDLEGTSVTEQVAMAVPVLTWLNENVTSDIEMQTILAKVFTEMEIYVVSNIGLKCRDKEVLNKLVSHISQPEENLTYLMRTKFQVEIEKIVEAHSRLRRLDEHRLSFESFLDTSIQAWLKGIVTKNNKSSTSSNAITKIFTERRIYNLRDLALKTWNEEASHKLKTSLTSSFSIFSDTILIDAILHEFDKIVALFNPIHSTVMSWPINTWLERIPHGQLSIPLLSQVFHEKQIVTVANLVQYCRQSKKLMDELTSAVFLNVIMQLDQRDLGEDNNYEELLGTIICTRITELVTGHRRGFSAAQASIQQQVAHVQEVVDPPAPPPPIPAPVPAQDHNKQPFASLRMLSVDKFTGPLTKLGQGAMGAAYKSCHYGTDVALKEILKDHYGDRFQDEINIQANIMHHSIVQVMGIVQARVVAEEERGEYALVTDNERLMMVSEYCTAGSLGKYLKAVRKKTAKNKNNFNEIQMLGFMRDIAKGMAWLHNVVKVVHKDLKPENIFLHDNFRQAKIGDFGLAKTLHKRDVTTVDSANSTATAAATAVEVVAGIAESYFTAFGNGGTLFYIAPECFNTGNFTRSADVYAFGIILHNCFVTLDESKTYDGNYNNNIPGFITKLLYEGMRPVIPTDVSSTRMSPRVASVILPMIHDCIANEVITEEQAAAQSRRPTFEALIFRLEALIADMPLNPEVRRTELTSLLERVRANEMARDSSHDNLVESSTNSSYSSSSFASPVVTSASSSASHNSFAVSGPSYDNNTADVSDHGDDL